MKISLSYIRWTCPYNNIVRHIAVATWKPLEAMKISIKTDHAILHTDLSYQEFFENYNPYNDGQIYIATYSFDHKYFDFWSKLEPLSVLYVAQKYKKNALDFLKRFPLFEVYSVDKLHTKAIFFRKSGRLLLGSENLYSQVSVFSELLIEIIVPEEQREQILQSVFRSLHGKILTPFYDQKDIHLHANGLVYLPCQVEVDYWDLLSHRVGPGWKELKPEYNSPSHIHYLIEYDVKGMPHVLAFDRGYAYCGDISVQAYRWLIDNCQVLQYHEADMVVGGYCPERLVDTSPRKDYFCIYHPIARKYKAVREYWISSVKNLHEHQSMIKPVKLHDITERKIRRTSVETRKMGDPCNERDYTVVL